MTVLVMGGLIVVLASGAADLDPRGLAILASDYALALFGLSAVLLVFAAALWTGYAYYPWHLLANLFPGKPRPLRAPWVIDGDTIDDLRIGKRYRLANIDAPETGDNARCHYERKRGAEAKRMAVLLVRSAGVVSVRETWRTDRYGRKVAYVLIDGEDLGELLVQRGLARPWRGRRRRWCGPKGGLAAIARSGRIPHKCFSCGATPPAAPSRRPSESVRPAGVRRR
jgi:hypothetical protein